MEENLTKLKVELMLWIEGFREACCLHRVVIYCLRSRQLMIRTGQCFLLNGFIFLGSIFILRSVIVPTLHWILPDQCPDIKIEEPCLLEGVSRLYAVLRFGLLQVFYVLWFCPMYILSCILSTLWYNDIAQYGFLATGKHEPSVSSSTTQKEPSNSKNITDTDKPTDLGGVMIGIAELLYSLLLLSFFFIEVSLAGFVPFIGRTLKFVLLTWMYSYYCFEYKWNLSGLSLDKRLEFFESNWAFFAGFGDSLFDFYRLYLKLSESEHQLWLRSPCVLPTIFFFSPLVSYGVLAILFPLFVLTAAGSDANKVVESQRKRGAGLGRLPLFYAADYLSMRVLSLFPVERREPKPDNKAL